MYITDRGKPARVLLTYESYVKLTGDDASIVELLSANGIAMALGDHDPRSRARVAMVERREAGQGAILRRWLDHDLLSAFANRILRSM